MKTILVPTDFSKVARNAIDYAVELAKQSKAKLILFHVFHVPVMPAEMPLVLPVGEMEEEAMNGLKKIEKNLHLKHGKDIVIECKCAFGFPAEEINRFAAENKVDLIVMGMEGTGYLTEKLIGSITTSLIKKAKCPVLAIDKHVKFKTIKKIVLACDFEETRDQAVLESLKNLASLFKSEVNILNVVRELEPAISVSKAVAGIKLHRSLEGINHSFHYIKSEDVVKGINNFVDENDIDMVAMIPRMHTVLKYIFYPSHTKHMAFHTKIPLLALHEKT